MKIWNQPRFGAVHLRSLEVKDATHTRVGVWIDNSDKGVNRAGDADVYGKLPGFHPFIYNVDQGDYVPASANYKGDIQQGVLTFDAFHFNNPVMAARGMKTYGKISPLKPDNTSIHGALELAGKTPQEKKASARSVRRMLNQFNELVLRLSQSGCLRPQQIDNLKYAIRNHLRYVWDKDAAKPHSS